MLKYSVLFRLLNQRVPVDVDYYEGSELTENFCGQAQL